MARGLFILPVLLIFAATSAAQTLNREKLRKAAYLPIMRSAITITPPSQIEEDGRKYSPAREIEKLKRGLHDSPEDAEIYLELASVYHADKRVDEQKQVLAKVDELLRPHLPTQNPMHGFLIAAYARYLCIWFPEKLEEAEKWARRAVAIAPHDARCWESLAWRIAQPAFAALAKDAADDHDVDQFRAKVGKLRSDQRRMLNVQWHEIKRRLDEAHECYQKARTLSPKDDRLLNCYLNFRFWEHPCRLAMEDLRGTSTLPDDPRAHPEFLRLQLELARRYPENLQYQFGAAAALTSAAPAQTVTGRFANLPEMTSQQRADIREFLQRLEKAAEKGDREVAATLHPILAMLNLIADDKAAFHHHVQRALEADSPLEDVWITQASVFAVDNRREEAVQLMNAKLQLRPSARACYVAASDLFGPKYPEETARVLRRGLEVEPNDPYCQLGLAVALLWRSDRPAALEEAGQLLEKIKSDRHEIPEDMREVFEVDLEANRTVYHGLRGDKLEELQKTITDLLKKIPRSALLSEIAQAFGIDVPEMRIDKKTLQWAAWLWAPPVVGSTGLHPAHEFRGVPVDPAKEIASLRAQLRNVPEDGILLNKIAGLQFDMGEYDQARKSDSIAKEHFEKLLNREPNNMTWKAAYASTLAVEGDFDRADRLILAIARINPADWRIWRTLGDYAFRRATCLLGFAIGMDGQEAAWLRFQDFAPANPSSEQTANLAERWLQFADPAYAKAVQLAPTEPDVWLSQVAFLSREVYVRNQISAARRQPINEKPPHEIGAARALSSIRQLCRLCPNNPYYLASCAQLVAMAKSNNPDFRKEIEAILANIERIGQTEGSKIAGSCHLNAATCCWLLERPAATAAHARKAVELTPEDEVAWNTLAGHLLNELEFKELLTVLTEKANRFPTPANHIYAAGAYWRFCEDLDSVERHVRAGLKLIENDLFCTMGMVAIALHRGDSPAHLAEAERWLQKADVILGGQKNAHHLLLTGILRGLQGDVLASQLYLREAQTLDPGNTNIKTALQAVSP